MRLTFSNRVAAAGVVGLLGTMMAAVPSYAEEATPTYTKDIAPILFDHCATCHRAGEMAPMSLMSYAEVRPWARSIKQRTAQREMPPWFLDKNVGIAEYLDDPSLTDEEIVTIGVWVDNGAPRGDQNDMPDPPAFRPADTWTIGEPDLVVSMVEPHEVPAEGPDWWGDYYADSGLIEDRWIKAIEVRPGNREAMHHVIVYAMQDDPEVRDALGDSLQSVAGFRQGSTRLIEYAVGNLGDVYADGTGRLLKAGAEIQFQTHYHAVGEATSDRTRVGFVFYPKGYTPEHILMNKLLSAHELDIPAHTKNVRHDAFWTVPKPTKLILFQPHMHYRGQAMGLKALYPDGEIRELSWVPRYDFSWQIAYAYETPPVFPAGTVLHMTSYHDNTAGNRHNPDPDNWVGGFMGRTIDEMSIGHIDFTFLTDEEYESQLLQRTSNDQ